MTNGHTVVMTCLKRTELCLQSRPLFKRFLAHVDWEPMNDLGRCLAEGHVDKDFFLFLLEGGHTHAHMLSLSNTCMFSKYIVIRVHASEFNLGE